MLKDRPLNIPFYEIVLALFLHAGVVRFTKRFELIPLDPVATLAIIVLLMSVYKIYTLKINIFRYYKFLLVFGAMYTWFMLTLLWSPANQYTIEKAIVFSTIVPISVLAGVVMGVLGSRSFKKFATAVIVIAFILSLYSIIKYYIFTDYVNYTLIGMYLGNARNILYGILASVYLMWGSSKYRLVLGVVVFVLMLGLNVMAAKQVYLALAGVILVLIVLYFVHKYLKFTGVSVKSVLYVLVVALFAAQVVEFASYKYYLGYSRLYFRFSIATTNVIEAVNKQDSRLESQPGDSDGSFKDEFTSDTKNLRKNRFKPSVDLKSGNIRYYAIISTVENLDRVPIYGLGLGSWANLSELKFLKYPHNSLIEVYVETGIIGILVYLLFITSPLWFINTVIRRPVAIYVMMLVAVSLLYSQLSFDLSGNYVLYYSIAALYCLGSEGARKNDV